MLKLVDDVLVFADSREELIQRVRNVLDRCRSHNIVMSKSKFELGQTVTFAGFSVKEGGYSPLKGNVDAIKAFLPPTDKTGIRSFLGLCQQLTEFVPDFSQISLPLRALLKDNSVWAWGPAQEEAFAKAKEILTSDKVLKFFDPNLDTALLTDASRKGIGFALIQYENRADGNKNTRLVQAGSRSLTDCETRYGVTDLEALAILYGVQKCHHFVYGLNHFRVLTDHKALVSLFVKPLADITVDRVMRWREKLQNYCFTVKYVPGPSHFIPDVLSRARSLKPEPLSDLQREVCFAVHWRTAAANPANQWLIEEARIDPQYQEIIEAHRNEVNPKDLDPTHPARLLSDHWNNLTYDAGLLIIEGEDYRRIYVPAKCRKTVIENLHKSHLGEHRMV